MGLERIPGIGPATIKKLDKAGIRTLEDMRQMDEARTADKTGIAEDRLHQWKREAQLTKVLEDLKGVGPAVKKKLQNAGIHNLDDLAQATIHEIAEKTSLAEARIRGWQKEAKKWAGKTRTEVDKTVVKGRAAAKKAADTGKVVAQEVTSRGKAVVAETRDTWAHQHGEGTNGNAPMPEAGTNGVASERPGFLARVKAIILGK